MIRTLPAIFLVLAVAACGSNSEPDAAESTGPPPATSAATQEPAALPVCDEVWVDGSILSADYAGCEGDKDATVGKVAACDSGGTYATYVRKANDIETPYIALLGGKVIEYTDDEFGPYAKAFNECGAG